MSDLALVVRAAWRALDEGARSDAPPTRWRDLRFVGTFEGRTVEGRASRPPIEWTRAVLRALRAGTLDRQCLPVVYRGESWQGVHPSRIDWTGYAHAGGDPRRESRSGQADEGARSTEALKLRVPPATAERLRLLARERGLTVSALVASLVDVIGET